VEVGKLFITEVLQKASAQGEPSTQLTIFMECTAPEGFLFSPTLRVGMGYHRAQVLWPRGVKDTCFLNKHVTLQEVDAAAYMAAKQLSANLLSHQAPLAVKPTGYQEDADSTFESDGQRYSLNALFRAVALQPVLNIEVSKLTWVLDHVGRDQNQARVQQADLTAPLLVAHYKGAELVVDGLHRLIKAVQLHATQLPYRRVSPTQLKQALLAPSVEQFKVSPRYLTWK
jgi:hypothetical protein